MSSDWLTEREAEYTARVLRELREADAASELLRRIDQQGGVTVSNQPLMFEARFAYELFRRGRDFQYEYPAGVGESTIDFRIANSKEWLIELVSVRESEGIRSATKKCGNCFSMMLSSFNLMKSARDEQKQSGEAEMMTVQHKIGEKVLTDNRPTKFPCPGSAVHAILVDMRGYIQRGGDWIDYRQITYGPVGVPPDRKELIHYWQNKPIRGLFEAMNSHPAKAAALLQERMHLLGFIAEKEYRENEIAEKAYWLTNPGLVSAALDEEVRGNFPLYEKCA